MNHDMAFPWYVRTDADRLIMQAECDTELVGWRLARKHRLSLRSKHGGGNELLAYWPTMAQAFDELQIAFRNAVCRVSFSVVATASASVSPAMSPQRSTAA